MVVLWRCVFVTVVCLMWNGLEDGVVNEDDEGEDKLLHWLDLSIYIACLYNRYKLEKTI